MKPWRALLLLMSVMLLLTGCMNYREHMMLNEDGSGELSVLFGMDTSAMDMFPEAELDADESEDELDEEDGVVLDSIEETEGVRIIRSEQYRDEDGWEWEDFAVAFDSLEALKEAHTDADAERLGTIEWYQESSGDWVFERALPPMSGLDGEPMDDMMWQMMSGFFADAEFSYSVTFPGSIIEANAPEEDIDRETNTVTWRFAALSMQNPDEALRARIGQ